MRFVPTRAKRGTTGSRSVFTGPCSAAAVSFVRAQPGHLEPWLANCCLERSPWQQRGSTAPPRCLTCSYSKRHRHICKNRAVKHILVLTFVVQTGSQTWTQEVLICDSDVAGSVVEEILKTFTRNDTEEIKTV